MSDKESKTEEATPKRIRDAKKKGQAPKSADLGPAVSLVLFSMTASLFGQFLMDKGLSFMRNSLGVNYRTIVNSSYIRTSFINNVIAALVMILPYGLLAMVLGVVVSIVQTGYSPTTQVLKPDLNRINPISGFKNIFSKKVPFGLVKNVLKLFLVFYLSFDFLKGSSNKILNSGSIGTEKLFFFLLDFVKELVIDIGVVMLALAIVDLVFQKREFKKNLRMTKQEIKDEYKEMEGNPQIKSARQQKQRQMAMSRMMSSVPSSTVVVTNPTHIAIALRYDTDKDKAPLVVAKGTDKVASRIKEIAKENKIPIMENKPLARAMYKDVEIGEHIPLELYKAVAEVLALVYQLKEKNKRKI